MLKRIFQFMNFLGITQDKDFCDKTGISTRTFSMFKNGKQGLPSSDFIIKICKTYPELNIRWLLTGEGEMITGCSAATTTEKKVKFYDISGSCGFGVEGQDFPNQVDLAIDIRCFPVQYRDLKLSAIKARGDSMSPTIEDGDLVFYVDKNTINDEGIYIVNVDGRIFIKRIIFDFERRQFCLVSDNKNYDKFYISEDSKIVIVGEIVCKMDLIKRTIL